MRAAESEGDDVGRRHVAAEQRQRHEDPAPPAVAPQVPSRQEDEERGERLGVVVVRGRPVGPRLQDQDGADTGGDGDGEATVGSVQGEMLEGPSVGDEPGAGQRRVLHDQEVDGVRPHPVQEGERPHNQLEVGLVEGIPVVRVVPGVRRVVRIEMAGGDLLPGLAVLAEVCREVEVVPEVPAVLDQQDELDGEDSEPDEPGDAQPALQRRRPGLGRQGLRVVSHPRYCYRGGHRASVEGRPLPAGSLHCRRRALDPLEIPGQLPVRHVAVAGQPLLFGRVEQVVAHVGPEGLERHH